MSDNPNYRTLSGFTGGVRFSTCPRPLTYIESSVYRDSGRHKRCSSGFGSVKLDSSKKTKGGNMYYQQRLGYITLGALFRQIRRGDNIQNSRC